MSEKDPPIPFPINPIYNPNDWIPQNITAIDVAYLNANYLRYNTAQGTQNFGDINVNSLATFNSNAIFNSDVSFNQDIDIAGTLSIGNLALNSADVGFGGIDCSGNLLVVDYTGSEQDTEMVVFSNVATTGKLGIVMNPRPANYNPIVRGDDTIMSFGQNNGSIANFCIAPWSLVACGLRFTKTDLLLGAGGTTTIGSPIDPTQKIYIDGSANRITITSNNLQVNGAMDMVASTGANRAIFSTYYNLKTGDTNTTIGAIYAIGSNFFYANNANSGNHIFNVNDALGVQTTPLQLTSTSVQCNENVLINGIGNYLQFPDGTQQTTAYTLAGSQKTYSVEYTSSGSIPALPTNCIGIGIRCVGRGGNAGNCDDGNSGRWASGGTGGGASTVISNGIIPLIAGTILSLTVDNTAGTGYVEIVYNSVSLCKAFNGNNGGNASGSSVAGVGGSIQTNGSGNSNFGSWNVIAGNAGIDGIADNSFQSVAGVPTISATSFSSSPAYLTFSDTGRGCGQRYSAIGGANQYPTPTATPQGGICIITYYLK